MSTKRWEKAKETEVKKKEENKEEKYVGRGKREVGRENNYMKEELENKGRLWEPTVTKNVTFKKYMHSAMKGSIIVHWVKLATRCWDLYSCWLFLLLVSLTERRQLKSPTITMYLLCLPPGLSIIAFYILKLCCWVHTCLELLWLLGNWSFYHFFMFFSSLVVFFVLKSTLILI